MKYRDQQAPVWVIWGLVGLFGVVQAAAWTITGGIPRRPSVLIQVGTAWIVMIILASLATRRLRSEAEDGPGRTRRQRAQQPGHEAVAVDGRPLHDPGTRASAPVGRLEASFAVGHLAAVATLAFVPAIRLTVFLTGSSVPTSVSLSSPRMNASTRLNAMSSWIWCGGLFMK